MSIILVRHGETSLNVSRTLQPADTPLSARGVAQATAVARRLAAVRIAGIVSSDLPRALATAQAIAAATGLPIETTALLQERNYGDLRGLPYDSIGFDPLTLEGAPPGGESMETFRCRVALAFAHVVRLRAALAGPLAVVTHGLAIRAMLDAHVRLPRATLLQANVGNTSLTIVAATPPHEVDLLDCTRHLEAPIAGDAQGLSGG